MSARPYDHNRWTLKRHAMGTYRWALDMVRNGRTVRRRGWDDRGSLVQPHVRWIEPEGKWAFMGYLMAPGHYVRYRPIARDLRAKDWELVVERSEEHAFQSVPDYQALLKAVVAAAGGAVTIPLKHDGSRLLTVERDEQAGTLTLRSDAGLDA